jgi:hypothetical protein
MQALKQIFRTTLIALLLVCISAAARAQNLNFYGLIVSVRGDIYQVEQPYLKSTSRVLITDQTSVIDRETATPAILKPGMRLIAEGKRNTHGVVQVTWMIAADNAQAVSWRGPQVGIRPDLGDGVGWFDIGGTIRSLNPGVLVDDDGTKIRFDVVPSAHVNHFASGKKDVLLIGQRAFIIGSRREGDILLAASIFLQNSPGQPGTIFGQIKRVSNRVITVLPRFAVDTMDLAVAPNTSVYKQIAVDPNSIQDGDTISIWGGHSADSTDMSQITAYVIMPGRCQFPASAEVSIGDTTAAGRTITGRVLSLSPFLLKTSAGRVYTVTIPGQTPTARYVPSRLALVKPGQQTMLVCAQTAGKLSTQTIVIDASPIVAMGL